MIHEHALVVEPFGRAVESLTAQSVAAQSVAAQSVAAQSVAAQPLVARPMTIGHLAGESLVVEPLAQVAEALARVEALARLDERAARVVELARQRAEGLRSRAIGPEHMLIALLTDQTSADRSGEEPQAVVSLGEVGAGGEGDAMLVFTASCEAVLAEAARQAQRLGDDRIGTEHLLLGLLTATGSPAVRQLFDLDPSHDPSHDPGHDPAA